MRKFLFRLIIASLLPALLLACAPAGPAAEEKIRKPTVSGQFYPGISLVLRNQVRGFLKKAESTPDASVRAVIVPHAGYMFSGAVAAESYNSVRGQSFDTVIVIGFPHRQPLQGVFVDDADAVETPLGRVKVDKELARAIRDFDPILNENIGESFQEHSVEVQIPFIQEVLPKARIVPVYVGRNIVRNAQVLADALAEVSKDKNVLIVASTDLSHFHSYEEAGKMDRHLIELIEKGDPGTLIRSIQKGECEACGIGPLKTMLHLREKLGWQKPTLLKYANSGDVTKDHRSVVGYPAFVFRAADDSGGLKEEQRKKILDYVRGVLEHHYEKRTEEPVLGDGPPVLDSKQGVFVTLKKGGSLRGCIGRIVAREPVRKNLKAMALAAALNDRRFRPVEAGELEDIHIHVSFLTVPEKVASWKDVRPGTDGIIVSKGFRSGVFLPEVATETGWDKETFFRKCALTKAGLKERELDGAEVRVFQTESFGE